MIKKYLACFTTPEGKKAFTISCSNKPKTLEETEEWLKEQCPECKFSKDFNDFSRFYLEETRHIFKVGSFTQKILGDEKDSTVNWVFGNPVPDDEENDETNIMTKRAALGHVYALYRMGKETFKSKF